jgi:hypothetical protein
MGKTNCEMPDASHFGESCTDGKFAMKEAMAAQFGVPSFFVRSDLRARRRIGCRPRHGGLQKKTVDPSQLGRFFSGSPDLRRERGLPRRNSCGHEEIFLFSHCQTAINPLLLVGVLNRNNPNILGLVHD